MVTIAIHVHLLGAHMREGHSSMLLQVPDGLLKHIDDDNQQLFTFSVWNDGTD